MIQKAYWKKKKPEGNAAPQKETATKSTTLGSGTPDQGTLSGRPEQKPGFATGLEEKQEISEKKKEDEEEEEELPDLQDKGV